MISVGLVDGERVFGALTLYSERIDAFRTEQEAELVRIFAVHASVALASARRVSGLEKARDSHNVMGIAQGILIAADGHLDRRTSWELLRRLSSYTNTKVHDLAAEVVRTGALPGHDAGRRTTASAVRPGEGVGGRGVVPDGG